VKKNILLIGIIWSILTAICIGVITGHDPNKTTNPAHVNALIALLFFQYIPSLFLVAYYLKTKSVKKIQYVILVLLYSYSFIVILFMMDPGDFIVLLATLLLIPHIGFVIWSKRKQSRRVETKNNHVKDKSQVDKNNNYDQLKKEISEYQLKKEMGEYQLKKEIDEYKKINQETKSDETKSEETKYAIKGISDLLKLPESEILEFKSTLKWDIRQEKSNPELVMGCVKTIAGFLNNSGGILIVGYDDDNNIVYGLEKDYPFTSKKCNYDGWQQYFINQVNDKLGKTINHYFTIESISYDGKTLAKINVKPSPEPVFTKQDNNEGNFYVRIHGQTENLNPQETQKWISSHFKK